MEYVELLERAGSARVALDRELLQDGEQTRLIPEDLGPLINEAMLDIDRWHGLGFELVSVLDAGYPKNLREVHDRPPLLFIAGTLRSEDHRAIAVIGTRRGSPDGLALAARYAEAFVTADYTVASGLATGIDTAAHLSAMAHRGRTIAVIGTGLEHAYPPENADLQRRIARESAVISQFWPDAAPSRRSFPMRNAVMSGISRGSVVIEASERSGARTQARLALAHGRPVFLVEPLLAQPWARELAQRHGVRVVDSPDEVIETIERGGDQP